MAKYENSITLARLFDGRDGSDGGSGYSMSFSSEEILKIPNGVEDREGERVPAITYAPTSLKVKVLFGEEVFDEIENKLENMTISVDYYGFDNQNKEWSITNLQNDDIKTLGQLKEVTELTKKYRDKYNGLFYYSYGAKAFIFNTGVLNYDAIDCYVEDSTVEGIKYEQKTELIKVESANLDLDTIYYDIDGTQILTPVQDDIGNYYVKNITYVESTSGKYVKYQSIGDEGLKELLDIINKNDGFFKITMKFDNEKIESAFLMRMALTSELATFSVHAAGIDAAIASTKLNFDINGLTVTNGGLMIENNAGDEVFYADDNGNLHITGAITATSGKFTGEINATSGKFTGGTIGGFTIAENTITSEDKNLVISNTGEQGSYISANNLNIGHGATVADSISLNNEAYIYNPKEHGGVVLQSGDTKIKNDGSIYISSAEGSNWDISADGFARFDKIKINSAEIGTSMMKIDTVQAVGSSMIFKPSYLVDTISVDTDNKIAIVTLRNVAPAASSVAQVGEFVLLAQENSFYIAQVAELTSTRAGERIENEQIIELFDYTYKLKTESGITSLTNSQVDILFTVLGQEGDFIFSINSNLSSASLPFANNSLSLTQITDANKFAIGNKILLGDLSGAGTDYKGKFGLYAENAILTGSLTTQLTTNDKDTYAGINTLTGATFTQAESFGGTDNSKIVFWAGASSIQDIPNSPFQVTEAGTLYAQQGYFAGSIISDAEISASKISASEFHATEGSPALRLYDTYVDETSSVADDGTEAERNGIWFMNSYGSLNDKTDDNYSFGINALGLYKPEKDYIIKLDPTNNTVTIHTSGLYSTNATLADLKVSEQLAFVDSTATESSLGEIKYEDGIKLKLQLQQDEVSLHLDKNNSSINLNSPETVIQNKVLFKGTTIKTTTTTVNTLEYRNVDNGYDLYVTTITE